MSSLIARSLAAIFLFQVFTSMTGVSAQVGNLEFNPTTGHHYLLSPGFQTVASARAYAQSVGGHLVAIDDAAEQAWINSRFPGTHWIGLKDSTTEGTFVWDNGQPLSYTHWAMGQPDNVSPFCTNADAVWLAGGLWYDVAEICFLTSFATGIVEIPVLDVGLVPGSLVAVPTAPAVGFTTTLSVTIQNLDSTPTSTVVKFYQGDPAFGGVLIDQKPQTVGPGVTTVSVNWTPNVQGSIGIVAVLQNLGNAADFPENNRRSITVSVGAPADQLTISSGAVVAWPGAVVTVPLTITNTGSSATIVQSIDAISPWATEPANLSGQMLNPGQSISGLVEIAVPLGTPGSPPGQAPAASPIPVAVTTTLNTFSATIGLSLHDQPTANVTVQVRNKTTLAPIPGATVVFAELPGAFATNGAGQVTVAIAAGQRGVFAYQTGFVANAITATIPAGASTVIVELEPGATLAVAAITPQVLTTPEIIARGVAVQDPVNNVVIDFVLSMQVAPNAPPPPPNSPPPPTIVLPNQEIPMNPPVGTVITVSGPAVIASVPTPGAPAPTYAPPAGSSGGGAVFVTGVIQVTPQGRTETWIVIPGSVTVLKQFYEVFAFVVNRATAPQASDIELRNAAVTLNVPNGIALPDLNGQPQPLTKSLGTIGANGGTATTSWIVRGDLPGTYTLSANAIADLFAFGNQVTTLTSVLTGDPFQVVLPQLRLEFVVPTAVVAGTPFVMQILVTNERPVPANLVRVNIDAANLLNCSPSPQAQQPMGTSLILDGMGAVVSIEVNLGDIPGNETRAASFSFIPTITGIIINTEAQVVSSTGPSPSVAISEQFPGNSGDLRIRTGINSPPDVVPIKLPLPGETITVLFDSPTGALIGEPLTMIAQVKETIDFQNLIAPGVWMDGGLLILVDSLPASPNPRLIGPAGLAFSGPAVPGLVGLNLLIQGVVLRPGFSPPYATTDAHEIRFQY